MEIGGGAETIEKQQLKGVPETWGDSSERKLAYASMKNSQEVI